MMSAGLWHLCTALMQGHRSVVGSSAGTIDFEHGAASNNAGISSELFWSDQPLPDISPSSDNAGVPIYGSSSVGGRNLSLWSQGEGSSSSMQNAAGCSEQKFENGWPSDSLGSDTVTGFEDWFNTPMYLSQDNIMPNRASNHIVNRPLTLRGPNAEASHHNQPTSCPDASPQNINLNLGVSDESDDHTQFVESHNTFGSGFSGSGQTQVSAATHSVFTPGNSTLLTVDNVRRFDSSHDAFRLPLKRKLIDEDIGQSSGSVRSYQHAEGSSWHPIPVDNSDSDSNIIAPHSHLQPIYGVAPSDIVSGSLPDVSQVDNERSSARNLRLRLSSAAQDTTPVHIGSAGSAFTLLVDSVQHADATFPTSLSFAPEVANQQTHPSSGHAVLPRNGHSFRRSRGSSSRSNSGVVVGEQSGMPNTEGTLRMSRQMLERRMRANQEIQVSVSRHLSVSRGSGSRNTAGSNIPPSATLNAEPNSSANMPAGCTWGPAHNFESGQRISEIISRSVVAAGEADHARSSNNQHPPLPSSASSRNPISASANSQRNQLAHRRLALLMQRRANGLPGVPHSLQSLGTTGEDRSRLLSEIWSALDSIRRGEPLRPEGMMILDQSGLFGMAAELHDRHRDMRLDVDNMSYEELLALEERIGNVNTGLTEEAVMKCLKQRRFSPTATSSMTQSEEVTEPCCICQEEYNAEEDVGILDCGHNFHTVCVKQWLMVKNLCPICKTTGLASSTLF